MDTLHVEQAIKRVVDIANLVTKTELARRAGVNESTVRDLGEPDWKPNAGTLRKLEKAAIEIGHERAAAADSSPDEAAA